MLKDSCNQPRPFNPRREVPPILGKRRLPAGRGASRSLTTERSRSVASARRSGCTRARRMRRARSSAQSASACSNSRSSATASSPSVCGAQDCLRSHRRHTQDRRRQQSSPARAHEESVPKGAGTCAGFDRAQPEQSRSERFRVASSQGLTSRQSPSRSRDTCRALHRHSPGPPSPSNSRLESKPASGRRWCWYGTVDARDAPVRYINM